MKIIDPGHNFELQSYDGEFEQTLRFMKREGEGYPKNVGSYPGTNLQEVFRACISRLEYLNSQEPCNETEMVIGKIRSALMLLEIRAKRKKEKYLPYIPIEACVESLSTCITCGHILCDEDHPHV